MDLLIAFYENRLKDHYVVIPPVLRGLKALVSLYLFIFTCKNVRNFIYRNDTPPWLDNSGSDVFEKFHVIMVMYSHYASFSISFSDLYSRQSVQRCLLVHRFPCWGLYFRMFMFRWCSLHAVMNKKCLGQCICSHHLCFNICNYGICAELCINWNWLPSLIFNNLGTKIMSCIIFNLLS